MSNKNKTIKKLHENLNSPLKNELTDLATKPIDNESTLRCLEKMLKLRDAYEGSCRVESYTVNLMLGIESRIIQKKVDLVDNEKESEKLLQVYKCHLPFLVVTLFFIILYLGFHIITGRPVPHWVQIMLSGPFHCFGCLFYTIYLMWEDENLKDSLRMRLFFPNYPTVPRKRKHDLKVGAETKLSNLIAHFVGLIDKLFELERLLLKRSEEKANVFILVFTIFLLLFLYSITRIVTSICLFLHPPHQASEGLNVFWFGISAFIVGILIISFYCIALTHKPKLSDF